MLAAAVAASLLVAAPSTAVDCYPPGSCDASSAAYQQVLSQELALGTASALSCTATGCVSIPVTTTVTSTAVVLSIAGATINLTPLTGAGTAAQVSANGELILRTNGGVAITLTGLKPGTWVDVYLNSTRVFLGKLKVGADGSVQGTLPLPAGVVAGPHTLQLAATTKAGQIISGAIGVLVAPTTLPATASRYQIVASVPGKSTVQVRRGTTYKFSATLANSLTGARMTGAQAMKLAKCTATVSVVSSTGRTLLKPRCMTYSRISGKTYYSWRVPSNSYVGKARATFKFVQSGRKAAVRTQSFLIVK